MPLIDLTVEVKKEKWEEIFSNEKMTALGHLGTHFDGMNLSFDINNCKRRGIIFDVRSAASTEIDIKDIDESRVESNTFILFYTGFLGTEEYGTKRYFTDHPQLSKTLIQYLLKKKVSMIGIDAAGIRRGKEHTPADQECADNGVFVVENISNLKELLETAGTRPITVYTFPVKFEGMSGLPCRVVAEI